MEPTEITAETLDLSALAKSPDAHKYSHGHALVNVKRHIIDRK